MDAQKLRDEQSVAGPCHFQVAMEPNVRNGGKAREARLRWFGHVQRSKMENSDSLWRPLKKGKAGRRRRMELNVRQS